MIRVILVDDHPVVREGLALVLDAGMKVVAQAGTLEEARRQTRELDFDVALLDLELPDGSGLELARELGMKAIILTAFLRDDQVLEALEAGVGGYLLKGAPGVEIRDAITKVAAGEAYLAPQVASRVATSFSRHQRLSARELSVLQGVVEGLGNKEIGERLHISERTVKFHVAAVMSKLGAENRAHAAALGVRRGLVTP